MAADDMEMEKIAEDELSKLQRQFRVMEIDRANVTSSVQPTLRVQRNIIRTLNAELDKIMMELKLTKSTSNVMDSVRTRDKLVALLKDHEKCSAEVREYRGTIQELDFLLLQVQKEIKGLKSKGVGADIGIMNPLTNQIAISQLENRRDTAMKKFNTVNSENFKMRLEIDRLLRDRQFFNNLWKTQIKRLMDGKAQILELVEAAITTYDQREEWCNKLDALKEKAAVDYRKHCLGENLSFLRQFFNNLWKTQIKRLMDGKAQILELVEAAITTYDQREEWCNKLDALKEKAAVDYRKHCLEVRELQRQLDHSLKLEEFLRTKGTVRLTAADAKAEAKRLEQQEEEMRAYNNYVNILDAIKEFAGEDDVDKLIQEFNRREEENYALFNYINEVNTELKTLNDSVRVLNDCIAEENAKHQAKLQKQQDSMETLKATLEEKRAATQSSRDTFERSKEVLGGLLQRVQTLALSSECDSLPLLRLLGKHIDINETNARLYIKSLEMKVLEMVELIKIDEALTRAAEAKERTPPSSRRRRNRPPPSPRPQRAVKDREPPSLLATQA
ncbi:coiled-coil domain-containing protein 63 [Phthorimaea operculella]|nr:coiled-coil domain-containing protein 63 [Phthorimaea operculella]